MLFSYTSSFKPSLHRGSFFTHASAMPEADPTDRPQFTTREEVMFFDTDCGGVVHNIAYLRMIETCRTKLASVMGMDLKTMADTKLFPVVTRTEINYRRPAKLGDTLVIHGKLAELQRARFWCEFELKRESDDELLVTSRQSLSLVQMPDGKPVRLPIEWEW
jgi:YbgC/YbaW family acyl-CoA thioester hydrolase